MQRQCLIVSPYFPPSTLAGVHRARHLAKYLPDAGWTPTILCVDESHHEERLDPDLLKLVPTTLEIIRTGAIAAPISRLFGIGDISLRAYFQMRSQIFKLLNQRRFHAVMITGSPYYPMLWSSAIARITGVPVLLDFQDPWVSEWGFTQPPLSKSGLSHRLAMWLEPLALAGASYVTTVSEIQNGQLRARYPTLRREKMAAIPIGADSSDFDVARGLSTAGTAGELDGSKINLSYVGNIWPGALEPLGVFLRALAGLVRRRPELGHRLAVNFIGTSNQPNGFHRYAVLPLAEQLGLGGVVREVPQRLPYLEALQVLAKSDGLILIGSMESHYTASKIYPNLQSGRPYVSLFHRESSAHAILAAAGGGRALGFSNISDLNALESDIAVAISQLVDAPHSFGVAAPHVYAAYEASEIAKRYGAALDSMVQAGL